MNKLFVSALCMLAVATTLDAAATKFTTKYDNVNLDEILSNDRLFSNYVNCILEKPGFKCTADGAELKKAIPEAIQNKCDACSEKQKEGAQKVIKFLHDNKPETWNQILDKYDPEGTFREKYKNEADSFFGKKE